MSQLQRALEDLERKLKEVQSVHNIVEFDADALIARKVTREKRDPRLQLASGGAAQLAEEVAQELKEWRKKRENAYAQRRRIHEKRHRDAIQGKRQEEQDKQMIREFVRKNLLELAKETLSGANPSKPSRNGLAEEVHGTCSAGATALLTLRSRLESLVERLEATEMQNPEEMVRAGRMAQKIVDRKRERVKEVALQQRFMDMTSGVDQDLLEDIEQGFEGRQLALKNQSENLRQVVTSLRTSVEDRQQAFQELDALNKGPASIAPAAWWKVLFDGQETESEQEAPERKAKFEDVNEEDLRSQMKKCVSDWGNRRIEEISESFYKRYSTNADASHEAWLAESQLEAWKMRTRLELLEELRREASGWHSKKMQQLRRLQAPGGKKGQSQNGAAAVAEAFLSLKARIHKSLQGIITAEVADHSLSRLGQVNSWHQAHGELIQEQQDSAQGVADGLVEWARSRCGYQLAEAAQGLVQQCHEALPFQAPKLEPVELAEDDTSMEEHFKAISAGLAGLEPTPETCIMEQQMLTVIDAELQRLCALFRSRDPSMEESVQADEMPESPR